MYPTNQTDILATQTAPSAQTPSFISCLPVLWSRVLFPGQSASPSLLRWQSLLILILFPGALLYPCMDFHLFEPDEGRYAEIPREMMIRGEWIVPYLQGEPYLDKPPLFYWLVSISYRLFGVHDWSARLIPALAVHLCVLLTYLLGRRSLGERSAFWGALALGLAPGFVGMGRLLILDSLLSACVAISWLCGFEAIRGQRFRGAWWMAAAIACGLGILAKGPVALILFVPPMLAYPWLTSSAVRVSWRAWLGFLAIVLLVALPWYIAICVRLPAFATYFLWEHNVVRFVAPFDHLRPIWFYGPVVLIGLLPATLLAYPLLRFLLSCDPLDVRRRSPEFGFMLLAGGWCVLFFSLSGCKLPTYVLPSFPPLALAVGAFIAGSRYEKPRWVAVPAGMSLLLLAIAHFGVVPWYAEFHSPMSRAEEVWSYCGDPNTPVVCYPRSCDSVSFYLGRDDLQNFRSKQTPSMIQQLLKQPRTVILFTHRHSLEALRQVLPPQLRLCAETPLSGSLRKGTSPEMCYMAIVERRVAGH